MSFFERHWYRSTHTAVTFLLLPLSWLFQGIIGLRRTIYRLKLKKTTHFRVPVIVVGNITVGGTGKTPFVIWLAHYLKTLGFQPGIVSRGVGGAQQRLPRVVKNTADPRAVGDEAILLANRSQCPVVIGIDRVRAVQKLLAISPCNVVISDDGLQHYQLGRKIEIAIVDGDRGLGNECFLPAGPLRESPKRLNEVNFVVQQVARPTSNQDIGRDKLGEIKNFKMYLTGNELVAVQDETQTISLQTLLPTSSEVHAVAAIGNPLRFFNHLRECGFNVIEHIFPDHYLYQKTDFQFSDNLPIIMTEKDAVKCKKFADTRFWYLPVKAEVALSLEKELAKLLV